ncbi:MAG: META domain-containing protein [Flavobacteriales bacterium]|nr:META domain-containing protein [Flavobacteriales bacterium]
MKKNTFLLIILLALSSCSVQKTATTDSNEKALLQNSEWILINNDSEEDNREDLSIEFKNSNEIGGFAGCNLYSAIYTISEGKHILFDKILSTKKYCPDIKKEKSFISLLSSVNSYKVENDKLILKKGNLELLTFKRK